MSSFATKMLCLFILFAGAVGVMIDYAVEGGSLLAALIIAALIICGTLLVSWWLMRKTGLSRELSGRRSDRSTEERQK
jgi:Kef-type K+ transport system membrane component KefB